MRIFGLDIRRTKAATAPSGSTPVRPSLWGWVRESHAGAWQQGVTVDPLGAVTSFGAVYACLSRIATDIAKLQPLLVQRQADGTYTVAPDSSPFWRALRRPNHYANRIQCAVQWLTSKLLYGNAYALKERADARGMVTGYYVLDPRRVTPMVTPAGDVYYSLGGDDLSRVPAGQVLPATEIMHDRGVTLWHPLVGQSPISACGISATQGLRIQGNSATFFGNMSRPSGMLTAPGVITEATAARLKESWEANYAGANVGRLAVLGDGLKYEPMTIPANDAQLIEQLAWTVEDVARAFAVPLYKINAGQVPTAGNVEALESQYYSGCLQVLIESVELVLTEGLELPAGMEVHLDLEGLLRMDSATQLDMLSKAVGGAIMAPNEARRARNLPPVPGGESVYLQQQNYSLEALARRDAQADPFGTAAPAPAPSPAPEPDDDADPQDDAADDDAAVERTLAEILAHLKQLPTTELEPAEHA
jgi:HK97 family phage portal protein